MTVTVERWAACRDEECPRPHIVDPYSTRRHLAATAPADQHWPWLSTDVEPDVVSDR